MSGYSVPSNHVNVPGSTLARLGRAISRYTPSDYNNYMTAVYNNFRESFDRRVSPSDNEVVTPRSALPAEMQPIKVDKVELYAVNNAKEHITDRYELVQMKPATPVLRRGKAFYMAIHLANRKFDPKLDILNIVFTFGPHPNLAKGTKTILVVGNNAEFQLGKAKWDVRVHHQEGSVLTVHVHIPASVCVGVWKCKIISKLKTDKKVKDVFSVKENIYILFNPWCKEDAVYLSDEKQRQEYVMNDVGKVYVGAHKRPTGKRWVFAQFDDIVLPACMYILELAKLDFTARGNPVKMVRAISATVNSLDDNGILVGRWDGDYKDGVAPFEWTGSLKILEEYMKSKTPVQYGQCWVFSALTTTICRALGIACRSVTNFVSAHDTDESLTIDKFFDKEGDELDESNDSIWNFHVWNDVWMARPDLPVGYGGWQAIDATPQEQSEDVYQAGPASVTAIRRGEIGLLYDTPFIFSEVNADVIHWQEDEENEIGYKKMKTNNYHVGRCIFTRGCIPFDDTGDRDAENILEQYKNPEGTEAERMAVLNAARVGGLAHIYDLPSPEQEDVAFDLIDIDKIMIGDPFNVIVKIENKSQDRRSIQAILSTSSVYYTGVQANRVKKVHQEFVLQPGQEEVLKISVEADEYLDKLVDYSMMKIYAIAVVKETNQTWTEEDDFSVEKPMIELSTEGALKVGQEFSLTASFTNPLPRVLHECHFTFEGPGLTKPKVVNIDAIKPNQKVTHVERFTPIRAGERQIIVNFNSTFLTELSGSKTVQVQE